MITHSTYAHADRASAVRLRIQARKLDALADQHPNDAMTCEALLLGARALREQATECVRRANRHLRYAVADIDAERADT